MAYPPLLFVHGAATGAWVWDLWRKHLRPFGWETNVLDLRGHGRSLPVDFSTVMMEDYVADLESVTAQVTQRARPPVIVGWSMGGMVAMMYAMLHPETPALVLLEPSMPREIAGRQPASVQRETPLEGFGPEFLGVYVHDPAKTRAVMPDLTDAELDDFLQRSAGAEESGIAMRQRQAGISVPAEEMKCPVLVLYGGIEGRDTAEAENTRLAEHFRGRSYAIEGAGHWGLVYHETAVADAVSQTDSWLRRTVRR